MAGETVERAALTPGDTAEFQPDAPPLVAVAAGQSDRGRKRETNEDQFAVAELAKLMRIDQTSLEGPDVRFDSTPVHLFIVADGMGGHAGGEIASRLTVETVEKHLLASLNWIRGQRGEESVEIGRKLKAAVEEADQRVNDESDPNPALRKMGSTLTLAFQVGRELFVAHAGDSRAYFYRDGSLHLMTRDHTLYAQRARRHDLPDNAAEIDRLRRTVTNAIGAGHSGVRTDLIHVDLEEGDRLLLCTDGLTDMIDDAGIAAILAETTNPARACDRLIDVANERGGRDNITVIVALFQSKQKRAAAE